MPLTLSERTPSGTPLNASRSASCVPTKCHDGSVDPRRLKPGHRVRGVDQDAAVVRRIGIGDHGHRDERVRRRMTRRHRLQVHAGKCVAIHQPQAVIVDQAERPARAPADPSSGCSNE